MRQPTVSESLYTAADLQGKESQCSPQELRELGDLVRSMEQALRGLISLCMEQFPEIVEKKD